MNQAETGRSGTGCDDNGRLSGRQIFCLLVLFLSGSVGTVGGGGSGRDIWLLMLLSGAAAVPIYWLYLWLARAGELPQDCFQAAFGRWLGGAVRLLLGLAAILTAAIDIRIFVSFTTATALPHTPRILMAAFIGGAVYMLLRSGAEVLARVAVLAFVLVIGMLTLSFLASIPQLDWGAVLPIAEKGVQPPLGTSFVRSSLVPFLESFFALMVLAPLHNRKSGPARPAFGAALFAGALLALTLMKNTMLLGYPAVSQYFFPSYTAASVVTVSDFFQRQELLAAAPFLLCELVKAGLCLTYAGQAFHVRERRWAAPVLCAAAVGLTLLGRGGMAESIEPLRFYGQWIFVPLLAVPALTLLVLRLRRRAK